MKKYNYERLGVMIDMSRNAVMSVDALKKFLPILKKMGYNSVMLYTEDTYEVEGEPFFGYMRGRYSIEEMKALDDFAYSIGIELIPCIQTLAHLETIARWRKVPMDMGGVLLTDDERTYEFIENMIKTVRSCFRTNYIHIGMDEAHNLGRGKHLDKHGYEPTVSIIRRHLLRVCEIAKKYDFECAMWSDMFFRPLTNGAYYTDKVLDIPQEIRDSVPESVIPVYWDYYTNEESKYEAMLENHKALSDKVWFAGGVWTWTGFLPDNHFAIQSMTKALSACRKYKVKNIFMTMWGDCGAECSRYAVLPSLFYIAELLRGNDDEAVIKAKFKRSFGLEFDDFMLLDAPNAVQKDYTWRENGAKTALYKDCFVSHHDFVIKNGFGKQFAEYAQAFRKSAKKSRKWAYIFDSAAKLCDVLEYKYELGAKTRAAYKADDKAELLRLAKEDYVTVISRIGIFHRAFEKLWFTENKPYGFEVQDLRLGGLAKRVDSCKRRLVDYVSGKIDSIPELEEELLPLSMDDEEDFQWRYNWPVHANMISSNAIV